MLSESALASFRDDRRNLGVASVRIIEPLRTCVWIAFGWRFPDLSRVRASTSDNVRRHGEIMPFSVSFRPESD